MITLTTAFDLASAGELIAFTGGGGKTSLLFALSRELAVAGCRVVATTTTRMATAQVLRAPAYCLVEALWEANSSNLPGVGYAKKNRGPDPAYDALDASLAAHGFCIVVGALGHDKAESVPLGLPARLLARPNVDYVLVEADGARMLPVKAPAAHEPAIPPETTLHVPVVGIDALSAPLHEIAHRPEQLASLLGLSLHETLQPRHIAALLNSPHGALRNAPPTARIIPFVNKVEAGAQMAQARKIARLLFAAPDLDPRIRRLLTGAVQTAQPVRAIIER